MPTPGIGLHQIGRNIDLQSPIFCYYKFAANWRFTLTLKFAFSY